MANQLFIRNGILLTMAEDSSVIENGSLLVEDGEIRALGPAGSIPMPARARVIDAAGCVVMPGLVNCHTHLPMSLFRGLADDLPLDVWLFEHIFPAEAEQITPASVRKWARHSCEELLLSGTTCCCDGYFYGDGVAEAALLSGIRMVAGQGVIDFPAPGVPDPKQNVAAAVEFVRRWTGRSSLIMPSIFCHSPYTCSQATLVTARQAARDLNVLFQIHVAETGAETTKIPRCGDRSVVRYLDDLGIIDDTCLLVHCVWIDEADMAIIKKRGAGVAHCAESNMKLAAGIAPVPGMMDAGITLGLGTDGSASNNNLDLFQEMDMVSKLHKAACADPGVLAARKVVTLATLGGARALGLDRKIGSLTRGKRADIILVNLGKPHLVPVYDPFASLVHGAKGSDVTHVIVDGRMVVENGELTGPDRS
ncbi:MAG: amidohydrolase [Desulfobacteraceae bacterium]|nr:amidohydrolase [Desulfobacteraceae bacterium]